MTNPARTRTAVVTGASSGFGRMTAEALAARGWHVLAVTRQADAVIDGCETVVLDIASPAAGAELAQRCGGRLDVLVNNAGYGQAGPLESLADGEIAAQFEVNVLALARVTRDLLPALRAAKGALINLSSLNGFAGIPFQSLYCASKFAVEGLSESLYYELKPLGVRVHLVEPGAFRTGFSRHKAWNDGVEPYAARYGRFRAYFARLSAQAVPPGSRRDPVHVVRRIVALAEGRAGGLRHRVGLDARATWLLRRWLPQGVALAVLERFFRRVTG